MARGGNHYHHNSRTASNNLPLAQQQRQQHQGSVTHNNHNYNNSSSSGGVNSANSTVLNSRGGTSGVAGLVNSNMQHGSSNTGAYGSITHPSNSGLQRHPAVGRRFATTNPGNANTSHGNGGSGSGIVWNYGTTMAAADDDDGNDDNNNTNGTDQAGGGKGSKNNSSSGSTNVVSGTMSYGVGAAATKGSTNSSDLSQLLLRGYTARYLGSALLSLTAPSNKAGTKEDSLAAIVSGSKYNSTKINPNSSTAIRYNIQQPLITILTNEEIERDLRHMNAFQTASLRYHQIQYVATNRISNPNYPHQRNITTPAVSTDAAAIGGSHSGPSAQPNGAPLTGVNTATAGAGTSTSMNTNGQINSTITGIVGNGGETSASSTMMMGAGTPVQPPTSGGTSSYSSLSFVSPLHQHQQPVVSGVGAGTTSSADVMMYPPHLQSNSSGIAGAGGPSYLHPNVLPTAPPYGPGVVVGLQNNQYLPSPFHHYPSTYLPVRIDPDEEKRIMTLRKKIARAEMIREELEQHHVSLSRHYNEVHNKLVAFSKTSATTLSFLQRNVQKQALFLAIQRTRLQMVRDAMATIRSREDAVLEFRQKFHHQAYQSSGSNAGPQPLSAEELDRLGAVEDSCPLLRIWNDIESLYIPRALAMNNDTPADSKNSNDNAIVDRSRRLFEEGSSSNDIDGNNLEQEDVDMMDENEDDGEDASNHHDKKNRLEPPLHSVPSSMGGSGGVYNEGADDEDVESAKEHSNNNSSEGPEATASSQNVGHISSSNIINNRKKTKKRSGHHGMKDEPSNVASSSESAEDQQQLSASVAPNSKRSNRKHQQYQTLPKDTLPWPCTVQPAAARGIPLLVSAMSSAPDRIMGLCASKLFGSSDHALMFLEQYIPESAPSQLLTCSSRIPEVVATPEGATSTLAPISLSSTTTSAVMTGTANIAPTAPRGNSSTVAASTSSAIHTSEAEAQRSTPTLIPPTATCAGGVFGSDLGEHPSHKGVVEVSASFSDLPDKVKILRSDVERLRYQLAQEQIMNQQVLSDTCKARTLNDEWVAMIALVRQETESILHRHNVLLESDIAMEANAQLMLKEQEQQKLFMEQNPEQAEDEEEAEHGHEDEEDEEGDDEDDDDENDVVGVEGEEDEEEMEDEDDEEDEEEEEGEVRDEDVEIREVTEEVEEEEEDDDDDDDEDDEEDGEIVDDKRLDDVAVVDVRAGGKSSALSDDEQHYRESQHHQQQISDPDIPKSVVPTSMGVITMTATKSTTVPGGDGGIGSTGASMHLRLQGTEDVAEPIATNRNNEREDEASDFHRVSKTSDIGQPEESFAASADAAAEAANVIASLSAVVGGDKTSSMIRNDSNNNNKRTHSSEDDHDGEDNDVVDKVIAAAGSGNVATNTGADDYNDGSVANDDGGDDAADDSGEHQDISSSPSTINHPHHRKRRKV